jgi:serine/threonine protein kinase
MYNRRIILTNYSKGSYGHIFKDVDSNIYKITKNIENNIVSASNINELIILNFLKNIKKICLNNDNSNKLKNTFTTNSNISNDDIVNIDTLKIDILSSDSSDDSNESNIMELNNSKSLKSGFISFDKDSYQEIIDENIFMQSILTDYYNCGEFEKNFLIADVMIANKYFDYLNNNSDNYLLVMKMVNYQFNLSKFIEKYHVYTVDNFDIIAKKLLKSLAILHHNNLLHGDLKTQNILIYNAENICLTDFGAVKISNFDKYHLSCTITSRCPEDLDYEYNTIKPYINSNEKSDIWSLGLIFAEMILGFNPILKIYQQINKTKNDIESIETQILSYYKTMDYLDILTLVKNNTIKNHLTPTHFKQISVIEHMLRINPSKRLSSIEEIYEKMFDEKFTFNFSIDYNYNYLKKSIEDSLFILHKIRKEHYPTIINVCKKLNIIYLCPLIIDILDRIFTKSLKELITEMSDMSTLDFHLLFSSIILIVTGFVNQLHISYNNLLSAFKLNSDKENIEIINHNLLRVLRAMDYDIYRPFNIYYCRYLTENKKCKCVSSIDSTNDIFLIHGDKEINNLIFILEEIITSEEIGISPKKYYTKLKNLHNLQKM